MEIKDRINYILKKHNLNSSAFADKLTIQRSSLSHILSGRNKPSIDFIDKFIRSFPNEDVNWLITGIQHVGNKTIQQVDGMEIKSNPTPQPKEVTKKKIIKVLTLFDDGSFESYEPNS